MSLLALWKFYPQGDTGSLTVNNTSPPWNTTQLYIGYVGVGMTVNSGGTVMSSNSPQALARFRLTQAARSASHRFGGRIIENPAT